MATYSDETVQNLIINTVPNEETFRQITKEKNQIYFVEDDQIDTTLTGTRTSKSASSGSSATNIMSLTLSEGIWILVGSFYTTTNGAGLVRITIGSTSTQGDHMADNVNGCGSNTYTAGSGSTYLEGEIVTIATISDTSKTYYLNVVQNTGSSITINGNIRAVRII